MKWRLSRGKNRQKSPVKNVQFEQGHMERVKAIQNRGIGHSVIRGLDTAGQWSSASSTVYYRGSQKRHHSKSVDRWNLDYIHFNPLQMPSLRKGRTDKPVVVLCKLCETACSFAQFASAYFSCHHSPNKTSEFSGNRNFNNIMLFVRSKFVESSA